MGAEPRMPRVFVGPVEIAGYYSGLAAALRDLGVDAVAVDLSRHPFRYGEAEDHALPVRVACAMRDRGQREAQDPDGRPAC